MSEELYLSISEASFSTGFEGPNSACRTQFDLASANEVRSFTWNIILKSLHPLDALDCSIWEVIDMDVLTTVLSSRSGASDGSMSTAVERFMLSKLLTVPGT